MTVDIGSVRSAGALRALAEPVRWRIVERLASEELCVCHLAEDLDLAQPLVSHHLKVLRDAGLVESERFRQWVYYRLSPAAVESIVEDLAAIVTSAETASRNRRPCC